MQDAEFRDRIHALKESNAHFAHLRAQYHEVAKELHRIETEAETPGDEYVEGLKRKRLALKDELYLILKG